MAGVRVMRYPVQGGAMPQSLILILKSLACNLDSNRMNVTGATRRPGECSNVLITQRKSVGVGVVKLA